MSYPASLEEFFAKKEGLLTQQSPGPSASKEKEGKKSEKRTPRKKEGLVVKQELESRASSPVLRSVSPCTSCPLCSRSFPLEVNSNIIHEFMEYFVQLESLGT